MTAGDRAPFASVIVPTHERPEMLAACLARLAPAVQDTTEPYEVIVSDDGRNVSARAVVETFPFARWVEGPKCGPAANRNNGVAHSTGPWLFFTDDDCLPDPTWISAFAEAARADAEVTILEGRTYADRPRRTLDEIAPINETGGLFWSCNLAIRRDTFESLGRFNERFPYATVEDMEFRLRMDKAHVRTRFVPAASVCHPWREGAKDWGAAKRFVESFAILLDLHPDQLDIHPPGTFVRRTTIAFFRETLPRLLKYREGFHGAVLRHGGELRLEALVMRRHLRKAAGWIRQPAARGPWS